MAELWSAHTPHNSQRGTQRATARHWLSDDDFVPTKQFTTSRPHSRSKRSFKQPAWSTEQPPKDFLMRSKERRRPGPDRALGEMYWEEDAPPQARSLGRDRPLSYAPRRYVDVALPWAHEEVLDSPGLVHAWEKHHVLSWLHAIGLGELIANFRSAGLKGEDLLKMRPKEVGDTLSLADEAAVMSVCAALAWLKADWKAARQAAGLSTRLEEESNRCVPPFFSFSFFSPLSRPGADPVSRRRCPQAKTAHRRPPRDDRRRRCAAAGRDGRLRLPRARRALG